MNCLLLLSTVYCLQKIQVAVDQAMLTFSEMLLTFTDCYKVTCVIFKTEIYHE